MKDGDVTIMEFKVFNKKNTFTDMVLPLLEKYMKFIPKFSIFKVSKILVIKSQ